MEEVSKIEAALAQGQLPDFVTLPFFKYLLLTFTAQCTRKWHDFNKFLSEHTTLSNEVVY